ncbi:hypothetical protein ACVBEQ_18300 [Nakamurella sp. GG22]
MLGIVEAARSDLAVRLGISPEEITPVSAASVVWPDSALGCRRPNMRYKQVPVDGTLVELQANGKLYRYHSGGPRPPFLCTA